MTRLPDMREQEQGDELSAIAEVLRGNVGAFERIVTMYQAYLYHIACSFHFEPEAARDAVQDIFLRVFEHLGQFDLSKKFRPWLCTIALNHLRKANAKAARQREATREIRMGAIPHYLDPSESAIRSEQVRVVRAYTARLPWKIREPIVLYYLHEMSIDEVSKVLGIGSENVKSRLFRGRKMLRVMLAKDNQAGRSRI